MITRSIFQNMVIFVWRIFFSHALETFSPRWVRTVPHPFWSLYIISLVFYKLLLYIISLLLENIYVQGARAAKYGEINIKWFNHIWQKS